MRTAPSPRSDEITLGDVTITRVWEYYGSVEMTPDTFFPESSPRTWEEHAPWLEPHFVDSETRTVNSAIQTWLLRSEGRNILIDTGVGNHKDRPYSPVWSRLDTDFLDNLARAGVRPEDVDVVVNGFAPDGLAGENCPDKRFLGAAGAVGKWSMRINTGGTTGIAAAYAAMDLLEAGRGDVALALGVERMAQARSVPAIFNSIFDPIYERDTGLSTISMCALRASRWTWRSIAA